MDSPDSSYVSTPVSSVPGSPRISSPITIYNNDFIYDQTTQFSYLQRSTNRAISTLNQGYNDTSTVVFFVYATPSRYYQEKTYSAYFGPKSRYNKRGLTLERAVLEGMKNVRWSLEEEEGREGNMPVLKVVVLTDCRELAGIGGQITKLDIGDDLEGVQREAEGLEEDCGVRVCFGQM